MPPAAAWREGDHRFDRRVVLARQRQYTPAAGRLADGDGAVLPDERLMDHEVDRRRDRSRGVESRLAEVRVGAAALVFVIGSAGLAVTGTLRHRDRIAVRHQPFRQHGVLRRGIAGPPQVRSASSRD
jgi:hypothetical protein